MRQKSLQDKKQEQIKQKILTLLERGQLRKSDIYSDLKKLIANEKALQRLLALMQEEGLIDGIGEKKARVYRLSRQTAQVTSLMMPLPVKPNEIPTCKTFAEYRPYLEAYFATSPAARGWVGFDPKRIADYPESSGPLLSAESISVLEGSPSWEDENDLGSTYATGAGATFLNQFSFNSSRLENAVKDLAETLSIMNNPEASTNSEKKIIVINHKRAVEALTQWTLNPEYEIEHELSQSAKIIKEIHAILMDGLLSDGSEGEVRQGEVQISGSSYLPTKNKSTLESGLHRIAIQSGKIKNPFEKSLFFLTQIAYIQAFADGNKRTARLVSNIPLIASKKIPHVFPSISEEDFDKVIVYYYETADVRPLEKIWLESYVESTGLFKVAQKDFRTVNIEKAELSPLRWLAIKEIVERKAGPAEYAVITEKVMKKSELKAKYPTEVLLTHVKTGLEKLYQSSVGALTHDIAETDIEAWRKTYNAART